MPVLTEQLLVGHQQLRLADGGTGLLLRYLLRPVMRSPTACRADRNGAGRDQDDLLSPGSSESQSSRTSTSSFVRFNAPVSGWVMEGASDLDYNSFFYLSGPSL